MGGYFVGCNNLGEFPYPRFDTKSNGGVWYSFPRDGLCYGVPTGEDDCTYSYRDAGQILIEDLRGTQGTDFWSDDEGSSERRINAAMELFKRNYPTAPQSMPAPTCDFNFGNFYHGT